MAIVKGGSRRDEMARREISPEIREGGKHSGGEVNRSERPGHASSHDSGDQRKTPLSGPLSLKWCIRLRGFVSDELQRAPDEGLPALRPLALRMIHNLRNPQCL